MRPKPRIEDKFKVVISAKMLHVNRNILESMNYPITTDVHLVCSLVIRVISRVSYLYCDLCAVFCC